MSLFERLGAEPALQAAVDQFYRKMLMDERVASYFDDVDMDGQIAKQKAFLTFVTGGPASYSGKDMRAAHEHLLERGLNDEHVDAVLTHLGDTLRELGAEAADVSQVLELAGGLRDDVLGRGEVT